MKQLKSKTIFVAIVVFIIGGVQAITDGGIIKDPKIAGYVLMAVAALQYVLRMITSKSVWEK